MDKEDSLLGLKGSPMKFVLTKVWIRKKHAFGCRFCYWGSGATFGKYLKENRFWTVSGRGRAQHIVHGNISGYLRAPGMQQAVARNCQIQKVLGISKKATPSVPPCSPQPSAAQREHLQNKWNPMEQIAEIQHFYGDVIY